MRSLLSVSLLAISLTAFGAESAQAQLKINPYPVQESQSSGRVVSSGQMDPAVVRELLARQQAADAGVAAPSAVVLSVPAPSAGQSGLARIPAGAIAGGAEYLEPVASKPLAEQSSSGVSSPAQAATSSFTPAPVSLGAEQVVPRRASAVPALDRVTVVVRPAEGGEFLAPRPQEFSAAPVAASASAGASVPAVAVLPAPVEFSPVRSDLEPVAVTEPHVAPVAPVAGAVKAEVAAPAQEAFRVYSSDPALYERSQAVAGVSASARTVAPMADIAAQGERIAASSRPAGVVAAGAAHSVDYSALARQQLGIEPVASAADRVDVAASEASARRGGDMARSGLAAGVQAPVSLYRHDQESVSSSLTAQDIAAEPVRDFVAPAPLVVQDNVLPVREVAAAPVAAAALQEAAVEAPSQVVTRADVMRPVTDYVADIDQASSSVPAQIQEQAMLRGIQGQGGSIIPDPLEGRRTHNIDVVERIASAGEIVPPVDRNRYGGVPTKTAEQLLNEADGILNSSIDRSVSGGASSARPVSAAEALAMPSEDLLADPRSASASFTPSDAAALDVAARDKVSRGEVEGELPEFDVARVDAVPPGGKASAGGWSAEAGESAYDVLKEWSDRAGVDLVWNSQFLVNVRNSVSFDGAYEEAVSALLEQYAGLYAGVEGTLYLDDRSGRKVLLIQTNGQG